MVRTTAFSLIIYAPIDFSATGDESKVIHAPPSILRRYADGAYFVSSESVAHMLSRYRPASVYGIVIVAVSEAMVSRLIAVSSIVVTRASIPLNAVFSLPPLCFMCSVSRT